MTIVSVWTKVLDALHRLPQHDGKTLTDLATLIRSGLESRLKPVVKLSVRSWNSTFGDQESLTYPKRVRGALKRLRPIADLKLPAFPDEVEDDVRTRVQATGFSLTRARLFKHLLNFPSRRKGLRIWFKKKRTGPARRHPDLLGHPLGQESGELRHFWAPETPFPAAAQGGH
jgi:hypothetical protein